VSSAEYTYSRATAGPLGYSRPTRVAMARVDRRPLLHIAVRLELRHVLRAAEEHRHPVVQARRHLWGTGGVGRWGEGGAVRGRGNALGAVRGRGGTKRWRWRRLRTRRRRQGRGGRRRSAKVVGGGKGEGKGEGKVAPRPASSAHRPRRDRRTPVFTATRCEETPTPTPPPPGGLRRPPPPPPRRARAAPPRTGGEGAAAGCQPSLRRRHTLASVSTPRDDSSRESQRLRPVRYGRTRALSNQESQPPPTPPGVD